MDESLHYQYGSLNYSWTGSCRTDHWHSSSTHLIRKSDIIWKQPGMQARDTFLCSQLSFSGGFPIKLDSIFDTAWLISKPESKAIRICRELNVDAPGTTELSSCLPQYWVSQQFNMKFRWKTTADSQCFEKKSKRGRRSRNLIMCADQILSERVLN